ncbi:DUF445 domain-containing protein [Luteimonas terricola]|uniref:Membrane protein n=1 Tax=Luteimonas terricola TaxID=645597 RepID=A0ABQ2ED97_9GAMM|nr:DUF445 domain-containing protein [Luteimonas terricola]GGK07727.1 membrane protein [Luteimonas terricola]
MPPFPDPREAALRRRKAIALGLLGGAGLGLVVVSVFEATHPHWAFGFLAAVFEAALVGGLADWFAVVALFRHPLGMAWIPHTAIIPSKKDALGASLADFICDHFLGTRQVADKLHTMDIAGSVADKLADSAFSQTMGRALANALPRILDALDSEELHRFLHRLADTRLRQVDLSGAVAVVLRQLIDEGRHQALVDAGLAYAGEVLAAPGTHERVSEMASRELWKVLRYLKLEGVVADRVADKLVAGMTGMVKDMATDRDHEVRQRIGDEFERLILRFEGDPALRERVNAFRDQLIEDSDLSRYLRSLWRDLATWIREDVERDDSAIAARISSVGAGLGARLAADDDIRAWINGGIIDLVLPEVERYREGIREFIVERVHQWSADELTRELELAVGSDLQFIRYNGTAVGALIGGVLYGLVHAIQRLV